METCAPVSHKALVFTPSMVQFTRHLLPTSRATSVCFEEDTLNTWGDLDGFALPVTARPSAVTPRRFPTLVFLFGILLRSDRWTHT